MITKYINADEIDYKIICYPRYDFYTRLVHTEELDGIYALKTDIDAMPAADVREVKHANWVHLGGDEWCCSCCGFGKHTEGYWEKPTAKYCEKCGAEINGVEQ